MTDILKPTNLEPNEVEVIQYFENVPVEYKEPNEFEINMLKCTYTPYQILEMETHDTIPAEKIRENIYADDTTSYHKDLITKVKVIALDECGIFPLSNPSFFNEYDKERLQERMEQILDPNFNEYDIDERFKKICIKKVFTKKDYWQYWMQRPIPI